MKSGLVAALDLGNAKVCAAIARYEEGEPLHLLGMGQQVSKGIRRGRIIDMEALEVSILNAVGQAEAMSSQVIQNVTLGLSYGMVSRVSQVELTLSGKAVDEQDLKDLFAHAQNNLKASLGKSAKDYEIIHAFPVGYSVNGHFGVRDPRGMVCKQLGIYLHVVMLPILTFRNLVQCLGRCHLKAVGIVAGPYASALATLVEDERDLGVTLVDMGGGTTAFSVFFDGHCVHMGGIRVGALHVTSDIAQGLSTPMVQAERLKTLHGSALPTERDEKEIILVPQIGENLQSQAVQVTKGSLNRVIRPRLEEILELLKKELDMCEGYKSATRRVVLTGGGSLMYGIKELASQILGRQVRLGKPLHVRGMSDMTNDPAFSCVLGLLQFASFHTQNKEIFGWKTAGLSQKMRHMIGKLLGE